MLMTESAKRQLSVRNALPAVGTSKRLQSFCFVGVVAALYMTLTCDAGAQLELGRSRWLDVDRGIVTATPQVHAAILKAINK